MLLPYQTKIIELMQTQERLMAAIYAAFSRSFPEQGAFWSGLAAEEEKHASWIGEFYQAERDGLVSFNEGKTKTYTLQAFIEFAEKALRRAEAGEFDARGALACALDFEQSLIEKEAFRHFTTADDSVKEILTRLERDTQIHAQQIRQMKSLLRT